MKEYYSLLGLDTNAEYDDIKKAYRKLAIKIHPDKGGNQEKFAQLSQAYNILSDPNKRKIYDEYGEEGLCQNEYLESFDPLELFQSMFQDSFVNLGEIIENEPYHINTRSADFIQNIEISLEDAYNGRVKKMTIERVVFSPHDVNVCSVCNGSGKVMQVLNLGIMQTQHPVKCVQCEGRGNTILSKDISTMQTELTLDIPKGVMEGYQFRFDKMTSMELGKEPGDLIFIVKYKHHPLYCIDDNNIDLNTTIKINLYEALHGFTRTLKMINGKTYNLCSNTIVTYLDTYSVLKHGFATQNEIGNLHVKFEIEFPDIINDKQTTLSKIINQNIQHPEKPRAQKVYLMPYTKSNKKIIKNQNVQSDKTEGCTQQ